MSANEDFSRRALAAFYRSGGASGPAHAGVYEAHNRRYVQVWDGSGKTLAVYRIENCERLKRLKRWPDPTASAPDHTSGGPVRVNHDANRRQLASATAGTLAAFAGQRRPETYAMVGGDIPAGSTVGFITEDEDRNPRGI